MTSAVWVCSVCFHLLLALGEFSCRDHCAILLCHRLLASRAKSVSAVNPHPLGKRTTEKKICIAILTMLVFGLVGCNDSLKAPRGKLNPIYESLNSPVLSADGRAVFFDACESNSCGLFRFDSNTSNVASLSEPGAWEVHPVISPTGGELAFARLEGRYQHIWLMGTNGRGRKKITSGDVVDSPHRFSSDGTRIFFIRTRFGSFGQLQARQVCEIPADGAGAVKVLGDGLATSPDGKLIIVEQFDLRTKQNVLWLRGAQDRDRRIVGYGYMPYFSPDGGSVVYLRQNPDYTTEIVTKVLSSDKEITLTTPRGYKTGPLYNQYKDSITFRIPSSPRDGRGGLYWIEPESNKCAAFGNLVGGTDPKWMPR